jgi:hypothetical protein
MRHPDIKAQAEPACKCPHGLGSERARPAVDCVARRQIELLLVGTKGSVRR